MPKRVHVRDFGYESTAAYHYVGRPSPFGNPFVVSRKMPRVQCVAAFAVYLGKDEALMARVKAELRGKDLGCHCGPRQLCHGDVLLRVANSPC